MIDQLVIETGYTPDKLVEDAMAGYVAVELIDYHYGKRRNRHAHENPRPSRTHRKKRLP